MTGRNDVSVAQRAESREAVIDPIHHRRHWAFGAGDGCLIEKFGDSVGTRIGNAYQQIRRHRTLHAHCIDGSNAKNLRQQDVANDDNRDYRKYLVPHGAEAIWPYESDPANDQCGYSDSDAGYQQLLSAPGDGYTGN